MDGDQIDWMSRILIRYSDAICQENQVRCILLALSGEIQKKKGGQDRLYVTNCAFCSGPLYSLMDRLRSKTTCDSGKKQIVCTQPLYGFVISNL